jgi:hypothetical protein
MNLPNDSNSVASIGSAEQTLRIVATLPAPEGLEERVMEALRRSPRRARVLPWSSELNTRRRWIHSNVTRGAAAAAIVLLVGGGSWGVYSRVRPPQVPRIVVPRVASPGGFSSAGAMRTPQTLNGPVLAHPLNPVPDHASSVSRQQTPSGKKSRKAAKPNEAAKPMQ